MIKFRDIRNNSISIPELEKKLDKLISIEDYFTFNEELLVKKCLEKINFKKKAESSEAIFEQSKKILKCYFPNIKEILTNPIRMFVIIILGFKNSPIEIKEYLERRTKFYLKKVEKIIADYEQLNFIAAYIEKGEKPRNHEQKTQADFYERAIKKKNEILLYYFNKLPDRAIDLARLDIDAYKKELDTLFPRIFLHNNFPFLDFMVFGNDWDWDINIERIDYKKINPLRNKYSLIGCFQYSEYCEKVDKVIKQKVKESEYLNILITKILDLPVIKDRLDIFRELKNLFEKCYWYGFYALALPQVEGIFAEMVKITSPIKKPKAVSTLTDKVQSIRPFYDDSEFEFDYYEYYLPNLRNKFAHIGKDDDIEIKCYRLVLDLIHIVSIYEQLNTPLIDLQRIISNGDRYFKNIGRFANFLYLIKEVEKSQQLDDIKTNLSDFIKMELLGKIQFDVFLKNLEKDFELAISNFEKGLGWQLHTNKNSESTSIIKIFSLQNQQIIKLIDEIKKVFESESYFLFTKELNLIVGTNFTIRHCEKYLSEIGKDNIDLFYEFKRKFQREFDIINILDNKINFNVSNNLYRAWKHTNR